MLDLVAREAPEGSVLTRDLVLSSGARLGRLPLPGAAGLYQPEGDVHRNQRNPGKMTPATAAYRKVSQSKSRAQCDKAVKAQINIVKPREVW